MSEPCPVPSDHAREIEETAEGRRSGTLREAGGDEEDIAQGSFQKDGRVHERKGTRGPRLDEAERSPRKEGLDAASIRHIQAGPSQLKSLLYGFGRAAVDIGKRWFLHDHSRSAAALAFYSLFSLVPLLVISAKLAGILVGAEAARAEISAASAMFLDDDSADYLLELVEQQSTPGWTGWMSLIAFVMLLFTASKVVVELREVLALIFGIRHREGKRAWLVELLLKRGIPILLILSLGFVFAISAMLGALFHLFTERYYSDYADVVLWKWVEQISSVFVLALLFTFVLRWLPPAPPGFRAAAGGAIVASVLLSGLRNLMNLYFENAAVTSAYGAAVTLVVVLLWIYFSVQIFFVGAETAGFLERRRTKVDQGNDAGSMQGAIPLCEKS